ncbi:MAG TPA: hypothetical protein VGK25_01670 [Ignavibacteria bacterium]|jgi:hypothetical protein
MFGFGKKNTDDPKKAIDKADKTINSGLTGFFTKAFVGQENLNKINNSLDMAKKYADYNNVTTTGLPATAEVLSIADTGALVNFNPVLKMKLNVTPQFGPAFQVETETPVSKIAIPRVGDKLNIKYNAANTSELVIIQ